MNINEMRAAVVDAENILRRVDLVTEDLAKLLVGRLRKIPRTWANTNVLCNLKRELQNFNITTRRWKN